MKVAALADIARTAADGDLDRADRLAAEAREAADRVSGSQEKADAQVQVVLALLRTDPERAVNLAARILFDPAGSQARAAAAAAIAATDLQRAELIAMHITAERWRAAALAGVARAAEAGHSERAEPVAQLAERTAGKIADRYVKATALLSIAEMWLEERPA